MTLKERLLADLQTAMRERDTVRRDAIRMVRAAITNAEIEWQHEAGDEEVIQLISRDIKQRNEAIEMFRQGNRQDLVDTEEAKIAVLQEYLPRQLTREEIRAVVQQVADELGATGMQQMGPVMREAMSRLRGRADGSEVNQVAREILG